MFAEHGHLPQNRVDAQFVNHKEKTVSAVEMSCPWVQNRMQKDEEKTRKYTPPPPPEMGTKAAASRIHVQNSAT